MSGHFVSSLTIPLSLSLSQSYSEHSTMSGHFVTDMLSLGEVPQGDDADQGNTKEASDTRQKNPPSTSLARACSFGRGARGYNNA